MTTLPDNPPGSTQEQLPAHILAAIDDQLSVYVSTACSTASSCQAARRTHPGIADVLLQYAIGLHDRCRRNQKFTGQLCRCGCHMVAP